MRPITLEVNCGPHQLAKVLEKLLSSALGSICRSHLRNSEDILQRLRGTSMTYRKMASFDVRPLFTNVPVDGTMEVVKRVGKKVRPIRKTRLSQPSAQERARPRARARVPKAQESPIRASATFASNQAMS